MPTNISSKTFVDGEYLTATELNAAIGHDGNLDWLKGALASIGITADSGSQTVDSAFVGTRVYSTGNLQVRDATWTAIPWSGQRFGRLDNQDFDFLVPAYPTFLHLPANTTPDLSGFYLIGAHVEFSGNATGQRGIRLKNNGYLTDVDRADIFAVRRTDSVGASFAMGLSIESMAWIADGGSFTCEAYQDSTADLTLNSASSYSAEMWAVRLAFGTSQIF